MDRATSLSRAAERLAWAHPELFAAHDDGIRPVNPLALQAYDAQGKFDRERRLRETAQTHGIYFFFRSDCPYCDVYAPLLADFARKYGFSVLSISLDGRGTETIPRFVTDNGAAQAFGVTRWPATFLVNPTTRDVMALGAGVLNEVDLAQRIVALLDQRDESKQAQLAARLLPPEPLLPPLQRN